MTWTDSAACVGKPQEWWFPDVGGDSRHTYDAAKAICNSCPVKLQCLDHAVDLPEKHGMWGGLTPRQRRPLRARRRAVA